MLRSWLPRRIKQSALIGAVEPSAVGKASGANNMTQELGGAFGVAILVAVFTATGGYASAQAFADGFAAAIGACSVLALAGATAATVLPARKPTCVGVGDRPAPPGNQDHDPNHGHEEHVR